MINSSLKKILVVVIAALLTISSGISLAAVYSLTNDGIMTTATTTVIEIDTYYELYNFRKALNKGDRYNNIKVTDANIEVRLNKDLFFDFADSSWEPIGSLDHPFKGTFDGQYHTINDFQLSAAGNNTTGYLFLGLFGYVAGATIKNVRIDEMNIKATGTWQGYTKYETGVSVGCLVGLVGEGKNALIENCAVSNSKIVSEAKIVSPAGSYYSPAVAYGGLVGSIHANTDTYLSQSNGSPAIVNCSVDCDIDVKSSRGGEIAPTLHSSSRSGFELEQFKFDETSGVIETSRIITNSQSNPPSYYSQYDKIKNSDKQPMSSFVGGYNERSVPLLPTKFVAGILGYCHAEASYPSGNGHYCEYPSNVSITRCYFQGKLDGTDTYRKYENNGEVCYYNGKEVDATEFQNHGQSRDKPEYNSYERVVVADMAVCNYFSTYRTIWSYVSCFDCLSFVDKDSTLGNIGDGDEAPTLAFFVRYGDGYDWTWEDKFYQHLVVNNGSKLLNAVNSSRYGTDAFTGATLKQHNIGTQSISELLDKSPQDAIKCFNGAMGENYVTNMLQRGERDATFGVSKLPLFYLPRTTELNNRAPLPLNFIYQTQTMPSSSSYPYQYYYKSRGAIQSRAVDLNIQGQGSVTFSGYENDSTESHTSTYTSSCATSFCIPYTEFSKKTIKSMFKYNFEQSLVIKNNRTTATATLYGYEVDIQAGYNYAIESCEFVDPNTEDTTSRPELIIEFVSKKDVTRNVQLFFGGLLVVDHVVSNGESSITGRYIPLKKEHQYYNSASRPYGYIRGTSSSNIQDHVDNERWWSYYGQIYYPNAQTISIVKYAPDNHYQLKVDIPNDYDYYHELGHTPNMKLAYTMEEEGGGNDIVPYQVARENAYRAPTKTSSGTPAYFGETNSGTNQFVYMWLVVETQKVDITAECSNTLDRSIAKIFYSGSSAELKSGDIIEKGVVLAGNSGYLGDVSTFGRLNLTICEDFYKQYTYYGWSDSVNVGFYSDYLTQIQNAVVALHGSEYSLINGKLTAPPGDETGDYSSGYIYFATSQVSTATSGYYCTVCPSLGYSLNLQSCFNRTNTDSNISIIVTFSLSNYSFSIFTPMYDEANNFDSVRQTYTINEPYRFYDKTLAFSNVPSFVPDFCGLLVGSSNGSTDLATIWRNYGFALRGPITSGSYHYYSLTTVLLGAPLNRLYIAAEWDNATASPVTRTYTINGVTYTYAKIADYDIGGIIQMDGLVSTGSMPAINPSIPYILAFPSDDLLVNINVKNVEYRFGDRSQSYKGKQYDRDIVNDPQYGLVPAATFDYSENGTLYSGTYYDCTINGWANEHFSVNNVNFFPYYLALAGNLVKPKLITNQQTSEINNIYDITVEIRVPGGAMYELQSGNSRKLAVGRTYDIVLVLTFKECNLTFASVLQLGENSESGQFYYDGVDRTNILSASVSQPVKAPIGSKISAANRDDVSGYQIDISFPLASLLPTIFANNAYQYTIVYAQYYSMAQNLSSSSNLIIIIPKGGYYFVPNNIGYVYNELSVGVCRFGGNISKIPFTSYGNINKDIKLVVGLSNFNTNQVGSTMPLYYIDSTTTSGAYSNVSYSLNLDGQNTDLNSVVDGLKNIDYSYKVFGLTSNKDVLLEAGFTHIYNGKAGSSNTNFAALNTMTQSTLNGYFGENKTITLLRSNDGNGFNFTSPLDYQRWVFELGKLRTDVSMVASGGNYYELISIQSGSYGSLAASNLHISSDDPYVKLLFKSYTLQINVDEFVYGGKTYQITDQNQYKLSGSVPSNVDLSENNGWVTYSAGKPYVLVHNLLAGQKVTVSTTDQSLKISTLFGDLKLIVYVPFETEQTLTYNGDYKNAYDSIIFSMTNADTSAAPVWTSSDFATISAQNTSEFTILHNLVSTKATSNAFDFALTLKLTPKQIEQIILTEDDGGLIGQTQYKNTLADSNSVSVTAFYNSQWQASSATTVARYAGGTEETLTYYTLSLTQPGYLKVLSAAKVIQDYNFYILPRLMTPLTPASTGALNYFVYPSHGYALKLNSGLPVDLAAEKTAVTGQNSYVVHYSLINYKDPVYYNNGLSTFSSKDISGASSFNITTPTFALPDKSTVLTGASYKNLLNNFDWAITSNNNILQVQGFTHILKDGKVTEINLISQSDLDKIFASNKQISLYRRVYPTIIGISSDGYEYDYQKITFNLSSALASKNPVTWGDESIANYYYVESVAAGSYLGDLQFLTNLKTDVDDLANYPYIFLIYEKFALDIYTEKLEYNDISVVNKNEKQLQFVGSNTIGYDSNNVFNGDDCLIFSQPDVINGQTVRFYRAGDNYYLTLDTVIIGFNFNVLVPINSEVSSLHSQLRAYYSKFTLEVNGNKLELDLDSDTITSQQFAIEGDTQIRIILTPRVITQSFAVHSNEANGSNRGGGITDEVASVEIDSQLKPTDEITIFAGSVRNITTSLSSLEMNYYSINFTAPTHLRDLIAAIQNSTGELKEYKIQIVPRLSVLTNANKVVFPAHGYLLDDESKLPISSYKGSQATALTAGDATITGNETYWVNFKLVNYQIPLYYYTIGEKETNYLTLKDQFKFNINSTALNFPAMSGVKFASNYENWGITSNRAILEKQGFTHILNQDGEIQSLISIDGVALDALFAGQKSVTLFKSNNFSNPYDYDRFVFSLSGGQAVQNFETVGEYTKYYVVLGLLSTTKSYGDLEFLNLSTSSEDPYIQPLFYSFDFNIYTGEYAYDLQTGKDDGMLYVLLKTDKQYKDVSANEWYGVAASAVESLNKYYKVYSHKPVIKNQTLTFNIKDGILILSNGNYAGFTFDVYAPYLTDVIHGLDNLKTYYSKLTWIINEDGTTFEKVFDLDNLDLDNQIDTEFSYQISSATTVRLVLTPRVVEQSFETGEGGLIGEIQYQSTEDDKNSLALSVFAGSEMTESAKTAKDADYTELVITAPSHLADLIKQLKGLSIDKQFVLEIQPRLVTEIGTERAGTHKYYFIYPAHGYALNKDNIISYVATGNSLSKLPSQKLALNSNQRYVVGYKIVEYSVPIYYNSPSGSGDGIYAHQDIAFNVKTAQDRLYFVDPTTIYGETYAPNFSWALTSNAEILLKQGFTHIQAATGEAIEIKPEAQAEIDAIFEAARQTAEQTSRVVSLYRNIYETTNTVEGRDYVYDYQKVSFLLAPQTSDVIIRGGKTATYYYVTGILQGSYLGSLPVLSLNSTKDDLLESPYIFLLAAQFKLEIFTGQFSYYYNNKDNFVILQTQNQYQDNSTDAWHGYNTEGTSTPDVVYTVPQVVAYSKLSLKDGILSLVTATTSFNFKIAVPVDAELEEAYLNSQTEERYIYLTDFDIIKTYYTKIAFILNDQALLTANLDDISASGLAFEKILTDQVATTFNLVLTPREFAQNVYVKSGDETNKGGLVTTTPGKEAENNANSLKLTAFAGAKLTLQSNNHTRTYGEGQTENLTYFTLKIATPSHLQPLISALNITNRDNTIQIVPRMFVTTLDALAGAGYYFYPQHGYQLNTQNAVEYALTGQTGAPLEDGSYEIKASQDYFACFNMLNYNIPLYYREMGDGASQNYLTVDGKLNFNIASTQDTLVLPASSSFVKNDFVIAYNKWGLTSNKDVLTKQGFTHINNGGYVAKLAELTQGEIDGIFSTALSSDKLVILYVDNGYTNEYDFDKLMFALDQEGKIDFNANGADVTYYAVNALAAGSYGNLTKQEIDVNTADTYLQLLYSLYNFNIATGQFKYSLGGETLLVPLKTENQYQNTANSSWIGVNAADKDSVVLDFSIFGTQVVGGQKLSYNTERNELTMSTGLKAGFTFKIAVPLNDGYILLNSTDFNTYYSSWNFLVAVANKEGGKDTYTWVDYNQTLDLTITNGTKIKLALTPREVELSMNAAHQIDGEFIVDEGGRYFDKTLSKDELQALEENVNSNLVLTLFAGTKFDVEKQTYSHNLGEESETLNHYIITITAPSHLQDLVDLLGEKEVQREYTIQIIPRLSIETDADYVFYPQHGYVLVENPIKLKAETGVSDLADSQVINQGTNLLVAFTLVDYSIPVYYRGVGENVTNPNYESTTLAFNVYAQNNIDMPNPIDLLGEGFASSFNNWELTSSKDILSSTYLFTHILDLNGNIRALSELSAEQVDAIFARAETNEDLAAKIVTLYCANGYSNSYDYDRWQFIIGAKLDTTESGNNYYEVDGIIKGSFGSLQTQTIAKEQDPYLMLSFKMSKLSIMAGEFRLDNISVTIAENTQYGERTSTEQGEVITWKTAAENGTIYQLSEVLADQKLSFNSADCTINLTSGISSGFSFVVAVPANTEAGYVLVTASDFGTYYSGMTWYIHQDDNWNKVDDLATVTINKDTEIKIVFTPKVLAETIIVGTLEEGEFQLGNGGRVSMQPNQEAQNNANSQTISVLAGSEAKIAKAQDGEFNYFILSVAAPAHFKTLTSAVSRDYNFTIYILPILGAQTPARQNKNTTSYFYPVHGYALETSGTTPVKYNLALDNAPDNQLAEFELNGQIKLVSNLRFVVCYSMLQYEIPLYYATTDENYEHGNLTFNVASEDQDLMTVEIGSEFDGWLMSTKLEDLRNQGFTHILNGANIQELNDQEVINTIFATNKLITLYNSKNMAYTYDYDKWTFSLGESLQTIKGQYYFVTQLQSGSYGNLDVKTISTAIDAEIGPYIAAFVYKTYNLTIDNLAYDKELNTSSIHYNNLEDLSTYFGVSGKGDFAFNEKLSENHFGKGFTLSLVINKTDAFGYPFFHTNMSGNNAFYLKENFEADLDATSRCKDNYYFLYNYGYEITGWKVLYNLDGTFYDLRFDGTNWVGAVHQAGGIENLIASLDGHNINTIAEYLDNLYAILPTCPDIYLLPVWQAVKIAPTYRGGSNLSSTEVVYGANYNLSKYENRFTPVGKSLIYFTTPSYVGGEDNGIIVNPKLVNGVMETIGWNYRNLPYSDYNYINGTYTIALAPVYVDNIYKVSLKLDEIKTYAEDNSTNLVLFSTDYAYATNERYTLSEYKFDNKELYTNAEFNYQTVAEYIASVSYPWVEGYSAGLNTFAKNYNSSISMQTAPLPILRKIYYTGNATLGQTEVEGENYASLTGNVTSLYIYIANNQAPGIMPSFLNKYYELILWHNLGSSSTGESFDYGYIANKYQEAEHQQTVAENEINILSIWNYSQTLSNGGYDPTLKPLYFRRYYYLNPKTISNENAQPNEYGYLIIQVNDTLSRDETINYLAICLDNKMQIFSFNTAWNGLLSVTDKTATPGSAELISGLTPVDKIKIYAGCDIDLLAFDQSKDTAAMASGLYDQMIGNKFVSITWWGRDGYPHYTTLEYDNHLSRQEISEFNLSIAQTCDVDVVFSKITYSYAIDLVDKQSGSITFANASGTRAGEQSIPGVTIQLGETHAITYSATLGYEFANLAFTLAMRDGTTRVLATYESLINDGKINQTYTIALTGKWLRENFYCANAQLGDFAIENNILGTVQINTTQIQFNIFAKIYDSSSATPWLEEVPLGKWIIHTGISLESLFEELDNNSFGYIYNEKQYAVVSSFAYILKNPTSNRNAIATYNFLLASRPTEKYDITSSLAENLGVAAGAIATNRNAYIVLEIRPLLYIDVTVKMAEFDTNSTPRRVTIQNANTAQVNALNISLSPNNEYQAIDGNNFFTIQGKTRLYTFVGQENTIAADKLYFDPNRYSKIAYSLNGIELNNNIFTIKENSKLELTFVPTALAINMVYQLDGVETSRQKLEQSNLLTNLVIKADNELHVGSHVSLSFKLDQDYLVSITRNGIDCTIVNNTADFDVTDADFNFTAVNVVINVYKKPNKNIVVKLQLDDDNQNVAGDNFGTLSIIVGGDSIYNNVNEVNVIENQSVDAQIALNYGYAYTGTVSVRGQRIAMPLENNIIHLIESFRVKHESGADIFQDAGEYIIYIKKELVTLELVGNPGQGKFTIYNNSINSRKTETNTNQNVRITGAYLGSNTTFAQLQATDGYELDYFYYLDKSDNQIKIVGDSLPLTVDLLTECCQGNNFFIQFGVATKRKFRVGLDISTNVEGLEKFLGYTTTLDEFVSGKYYPTNTNVEFSFYGTPLGKYDVTVTVNGEKHIRDEQGYTNCQFELKQDTTIYVYIEQTTFHLFANEYHCQTLQDMQDPYFAPADAKDWINSLPATSRYNHETTLSVVVKTDDYLLDKVELQIDTLNTLLLEIENGEIKASFNGTVVNKDADGFYNVIILGTSYSYQIALENNRLTITYTTVQDLSINLRYISIKEIV